MKNEHDALDIVSEAAYRAMCKLHTLRNKDSFRPWMTRIVVNCAVDFVRRGQPDYIEDVFPELEQTSESELCCEDSLDLYDALDCLSAAEKSCVVLKFFEGYTFRELAAMLDEPESTVKSRVSRALKKMAQMLEE